MNGDSRPHYRRQQRGGPACGGTELGRGRRDDLEIGEGAWSGLAVTRALVAVGAYAAEDLRDREGMTRPLLRRTALRLTVSRHTALHRLGEAYLGRDPATPAELAAGRDVAPRLLLPPGQSRSESARSSRPSCRPRQFEDGRRRRYHGHMLVISRGTRGTSSD